MVEEFPQGFGNVGILAMDQGVVPLDDCHAAAEASHGLGQLESHVAAPQDDEVAPERGPIKCG
jgi:hypothetical protein